MSLIYHFKKNETLESWHNWLMNNWSRLVNSKRDLGYLASVLQIVQNIAENCYPCLYLSIGQVCRLNDVTDLVNHGIVKNIKTWISWERDITFLRDIKIFNLCVRWHILRSYRFVTEKTFKSLVAKLRFKGFKLR